MGHKTRIMYIECKGGNLTGPARIGRVTYSKTGRSLTYDGKSFMAAEGFKSNYICNETGEDYWISGPKKRGGDALYATNSGAVIDEDVREEYWTTIRNQPERIKESKTL